VLVPDGEVSLQAGQRLPAHDALPGLTPAVADLFAQVSAPDPS
jgi:hypothetical protein